MICDFFFPWLRFDDISVVLSGNAINFLCSYMGKCFVVVSCTKSYQGGG